MKNFFSALEVPPEDADLLGHLLPRPGMISLIGGGGKTTTMLRLARELVERGRTPVIITTSTKIAWPEDMPVAQSREELDSLLAEGTELLAVGLHEGRKMSPPDYISWKDLLALAPYVINEADGSRGLPLKYHDFSYEPAIPEETTLLLALVGLSFLGRPVSEVVQRAYTVGPYHEGEDPLVDVPRALEILERYPRPDFWLLNQVDILPNLGEARELAAALVSSRVANAPVLLLSSRSMTPVRERWENSL